MLVKEFDIQKGIYHFKMSDLATSLHAHPVVEIVYASEGTFSLDCQEKRYEGLTFAIIDANVKHQLEFSDASVNLLMLESNNEVLNQFFRGQQIQFKDGIYSSDSIEKAHHFFSTIEVFIKGYTLNIPEDHRIQKSIQILQQEDLEYSRMLSELKAQVFLSESRLSHLFSKEMGISLKKYLLWCKLKKAIHLLLTEEKTLMEVCYEAGFFDQAHMSNAFKNMFGISPAKEYNSRNLQFRQD